MRQSRWLLLLCSGLPLLWAACQQPYRVFAVQIASASHATQPSAPGVPRASADPPPASLPALVRQSRTKREPVDLNRAPAALLRTLPGMDAATLQRILAARPYQAKRELLKRGILTSSQYALWKSYLVVHRAHRTRVAGQP